jgi:nucleoside-diphosphate-sugar epimerase
MIFVTGGTGMVGGEIVRLLSQNGIFAFFGLRTSARAAVLIAPPDGSNDSNGEALFDQRGSQEAVAK